MPWSGICEYVNNCLLIDKVFIYYLVFKETQKIDENGQDRK